MRRMIKPQTVATVERERERERELYFTCYGKCNLIDRKEVSLNE